MSDELEATDQDLRWGDTTPCASQRRMEARIAEVYARCVHRPVEAVRASVFVEGLQIGVPVQTEAATRIVAGPIFAFCAEWLGGFAVENAPHSMFLLGCGPGNEAAFRICSFDLTAMMCAARTIGRESFATSVLVVHSTMQTLGADGSDALDAADRLLIHSVMDAGGDYKSLPWGSAYRAVARVFDGRTGREFSWSWIQTIGEGGARDEFDPRVLAPYLVVEVDEDGKAIPKPGSPSMAEA